MQKLLKELGDLFPIWESFDSREEKPFEDIERFIEVRECHFGFVLKADPIGDGMFCYRPKANYVITLFDGTRPDFLIIKKQTSPLYRWGIHASTLDGDITLFTPYQDVIDERLFRDHQHNVCDSLAHAHSRN